MCFQNSNRDGTITIQNQYGRTWVYFHYRRMTAKEKESFVRLRLALEDRQHLEEGLTSYVRLAWIRWLLPEPKQLVHVGFLFLISKCFMLKEPESR